MPRKSILLAAILATFVVGSALSAASRTGGADGTQRYTPTAIEWLNVYCSSLGREKVGYYSACESDGKNTITVQIGYWDTALKKEAEDEFIPIDFLLKAYAHEKGWNWLKIVKKVEFISAKGKP